LHARPSYPFVRCSFRMHFGLGKQRLAKRIFELHATSVAAGPARRMFSVYVVSYRLPLSFAKLARLVYWWRSVQGALSVLFLVILTTSLTHQPWPPVWPTTRAAFCPGWGLCMGRSLLLSMAKTLADCTCGPYAKLLLYGTYTLHFIRGPVSLKFHGYLKQK
jgi:hypothetical protein